MTTYYCPRGCNVFSTEVQYEDHDGPECGSCGQIMTTDSEPFDDAHEQREIAGIAECERRVMKKSPTIMNAYYIPQDEKDRYTCMQVLRSTAGWYVGTLYCYPDGGFEPGTRDSDYFGNYNDAAKHLAAIEAGEAANEQPKNDLLAECERRLQPQILKDATGFFIAAEFAGTGMVRVSLEYWKTFEQARKALIRSSWTARDLGSSDWTYAR